MCSLTAPSVKRRKYKSIFFLQAFYLFILYNTLLFQVRYYNYIKLLTELVLTLLLYRQITKITQPTYQKLLAARVPLQCLQSIATTLRVFFLFFYTTYIFIENWLLLITFKFKLN